MRSRVVPRCLLMRRSSAHYGMFRDVMGAKWEQDGRKRALCRLLHGVRNGDGSRVRFPNGIRDHEIRDRELSAATRSPRSARRRARSTRPSPSPTSRRLGRADSGIPAASTHRRRDSDSPAIGAQSEPGRSPSDSSHTPVPRSPWPPNHPNGFWPPVPDEQRADDDAQASSATSVTMSSPPRDSSTPNARA